VTVPPAGLAGVPGVAGVIFRCLPVILTDFALSFFAVVVVLLVVDVEVVTVGTSWGLNWLVEVVAVVTVLALVAPLAPQPARSPVRAVAIRASVVREAGMAKVG
jgi:hypothetical protein